jgi:integrase/recombinase XerC
MPHDLVKIGTQTRPVPAATATAGEVLEAWLAGRNPRTLRAYAFDLSDFARFAKAPSAEAAVGALFAGGPGLANRRALAYRADLTGRGLASATIARRLSALKSLVKVARLIGRITWTLDVPGPRVQPYRDTTGPGQEGWALIHAEGRQRSRAIDKRNLALIRLLHDRALRRGEAIAMNLADVDLAFEPWGRIAIIGKGKTEPEFLTLNRRTRDALRDWIAVRGPEPGPLFVRLDRAAGKGELAPMTGDSVNRMVRRLSRRAGLAREARAHGLRHQGITRALDKTHGDVRKVRTFSRHAKVETVLIYDDARKDEGGDITRMFDDDD